MKNSLWLFYFYKKRKIAILKLTLDSKHRNECLLD